jgi:hypothetical protein
MMWTKRTKTSADHGKMARGFKVSVVAAAVACAHLCRSSIALSANCFTTGSTRSRSSPPRPAHQHHQQQEHYDDDHRADHAPPTTIIKGGGAVFDQARRKFAAQIMVGGILAWVPGVSLAKESSLETDKKNLVEVRRAIEYFIRAAHVCAHRCLSSSLVSVFLECRVTID